MWSALGNYRDFALAILRAGLGVVIIVVHGWPKLAGGMAKWKAVGLAMKHVGISFAPVFWGFMAAFSESLGCLLIVLGLFFRPACLLLLITLIIATISDLRTGGFAKASHAVELAIVFFSLIFLGPGKYSFDKS
jgi:putative oxidoreductase